MQLTIDERVGCSLGFVEEMAIQQHLVQHPSQLQRLVRSTPVLDTVLVSECCLTLQRELSW